MPATVPLSASAVGVPGNADVLEEASSGCARAHPAVNQAAVRMLLLSRNLRFIENAEGNGVWEWPGCIKDYVSVSSAKEFSGGAGDLVAGQEDSQVTPWPIAS
jgi:hypothetical protein